MNNFIADQTFKGKDYTQNRLPKADYENCVFKGCDFANGYLDNQNFMECKFVDCNLSNANIAHTIFKEVIFSHSKLIGLKFEDCNDFLMDFSFQDCILNFSSFYGLKLKSQRFMDCKLEGVDFTEATLVQAQFAKCDLQGAIFSATVLENADFRTARNFNIDPERNRLKKAQFSKEGAIGLLKKYDIVVK